MTLHEIWGSASKWNSIIKKYYEVNKNRILYLFTYKKKTKITKWYSRVDIHFTVSIDEVIVGQ